VTVYSLKKPLTRTGRLSIAIVGVLLSVGLFFVWTWLIRGTYDLGAMLKGDSGFTGLMNKISQDYISTSVICFGFTILLAILLGSLLVLVSPSPTIMISDDGIKHSVWQKMLPWSDIGEIRQEKQGTGALQSETLVFCRTKYPHYPINKIPRFDTYEKTDEIILLINEKLRQMAPQSANKGLL